MTHLVKGNISFNHEIMQSRFPIHIIMNANYNLRRDKKQSQDYDRSSSWSFMWRRINDRKVQMSLESTKGKSNPKPKRKKKSSKENGINAVD